MARDLGTAGTKYTEIDRALLSPSSPWSISAFFFPVTDGASQFIVGISDISIANDWFGLRFRADQAGDPLAAYHFDSGNTARYAQTTVAPTFNAWNHGLATSSGLSNRVIYLNGTNKVTNTDAASTDDRHDRTSIGRTGDSSPNYYYEGPLAEVTLWDVQLTDRDAWDLWCGKPAWMIRQNHIVGFYYPMAHAYRSDRDFSRSRAHMTAYNAPVWAHDPQRVLAYRQQMVLNNPALARYPLWMRFHPEMCIKVAGLATEGARIPRHGFTLFQLPGIV